MGKSAVVAAMALVAFMCSCAPWKTVARVDMGVPGQPIGPSGNECALASARTLAVVYRQWDLQAIRAADPDVIVIDYVEGHNECGELDTAQVLALAQRPGDPRGNRLVLARLNIGKPEQNRLVFMPAGGDGRCQPAVMIPTAPGRPEGTPLAFGDDAWYSAVVEADDSALNRILRLGFDGVYLDGIDVAMAASAGDATAPERMVDFIASIRQQVREFSPNFLVVVKDPQSLMGVQQLFSVISGAAFHGAMFSGGYVRPQADLVPVLDMFNRLKAAGKAVLAVEFIQDDIQKAHLATVCSTLGYLCYSGVEYLNHLEQLTWAGNGGACH